MLSTNVVLTILLYFFVFYTASPAIASFSDQYGSYGDLVSMIEDAGPDWNGDGVGDFYIYYPTDMINGNYPIIIFCVGTGAHPETSYGGFLREYASQGFVIIAGTDKNQQEGDQAVCGLDYIISENSNPNSIFFNKLDTSHIMSIGHSQGGNACLHVAIKDPRITAVLSMMPAIGNLQSIATADATKIVVPVFYVTAKHDYVVWPSRVKRIYYNNTKNTDAWFVTLYNTGHNDCPKALRYILKEWMLAQLYHDSIGEYFFYDYDPMPDGGGMSFVTDMYVALWEDSDVLLDAWQYACQMEKNFE